MLAPYIQWAWIIITVFVVIDDWKRDQQPVPAGKYEFRQEMLKLAVATGIMYLGGFFDCIARSFQ